MTGGVAGGVAAGVAGGLSGGVTRGKGPIAVLAGIALWGACAPADPGRPSSPAVAPESVAVPLPPLSRIPTAAPRWTARLERVPDPRGGRWSAYAPSGLAESGGRVLVVDEGNHELALLDAGSGRAVAIAGGLGQRDGELYAPGDVAAIGRRQFVADRNNHRIVPVEATGGFGPPLALSGPPLRLAAAPDERLYALALLRDRGVRLLRLTGCCVSPAVDTIALSPPLRRLPRALAVLGDRRVVLVTPTGGVELYAADGTLTRVVQFVGERAATSGVGVGGDSLSPASLSHAQAVHASEGDGGSRLTISFGFAVGCLDLSSLTLDGLWKPPASARGFVPGVALVGRGERGTYAYQPAESVVALYPGTC